MFIAKEEGFTMNYQTEGSLLRQLFSRNKKGEIFTQENIKSVRPADGLSPKYLKFVLGKKAKRDIEKGTPLNLNLIV